MISLQPAREVCDGRMTRKNNLPVSTLLICTDETKEKNRQGRAYCRLFRECVYFWDLGELLLKADKMFDEVGYPQAYQQSASFAKKGAHPAVYIPDLYFSETEFQKKQGKISTEYVIIKSRRKSGWQGTYINCKGEPVDFISEMELLRYMDSSFLALCSKDTKRYLNL